MYKILSINGPVITIRGDGFAMHETVYINKMPGEVIFLKPSRATVQIYENPAGITTEAAVEKTGHPMSLTMRPGIVGGIFDGIMRPLNEIRNTFYVSVLTSEGEFLREGDVFAAVNETEIITYRATLPPNVSGTVVHAVPSGEYSCSQEIIKLKTPDGEKSFSLCQTWPIRVPRPVKNRLRADTPLITGQRVIDSLFPVAKGGTCAIPGGFGTGKTMTQHQIAKHCDADIIIYIGCGERGNEMTEVLQEFSRLNDPKNGHPLLSRTVLIANTSDMPVAAREASIYTGITLAECYRDMGYDVAVMADSTSRWSEALRELSSRLDEIPAEEGYPAYLASRIAAFYSRAGFAENLNGTRGSVTIIGAVSPQGGDFSEPVTLHTKRFTRCFWALDRKLAYARHYPAINPLQSYSGYTPELDEWFINIHPLFPKHREEILKILYEEAALQEVIKLTGADSLPQKDRNILAAAKTIRQKFTAQNARDPIDTYTPPHVQFEMMDEILRQTR